MGKKERAQTRRALPPRQLESWSGGGVDGFAPSADSKPALRVPGASASVCNVLKLWNSMSRWIFRSGSSFATFLQSMVSRSSVDDDSAPPLWPIPAPYPCWFSSGGGAVNYRRMCVEKAINLAVLALSWLHLNRPKTAPTSLWVGRPLTSKQWGVVKRFEKLFAEVAASGDFGPSAMGRSAAKVESLAAILDGFEKIAKQPPSFYDHQLSPQGGLRTSPQVGHELGDPGTVVGAMRQGAPWNLRGCLFHRMLQSLTLVNSLMNLIYLCIKTYLSSYGSQ